MAGLTWPQAQDRRGRLLVVPLGATEQHGPHLPLSTDTDVAVALAERLAAVRDDVDVAPAVPYGASGEHAGFPGTLSVGTAALELLLVELCRSATDTWDRVLLLSGHGGNAAGRARGRRPAAQRVARRAGVVAVVGRGRARGPHRDLRCSSPSTPPGSARPQAGVTTPVRALLPALRAGGVRAVSPNGVLGDPAGASAAEGERLLASAVEALGAWL